MSNQKRDKFYIRFAERSCMCYGVGDDLSTALGYFNGTLLDVGWKESIEEDGIRLMRYFDDAEHTVLAKGYLKKLPAHTDATTEYYVHAVSEIQSKLVELAEGRYEVLDSDWDIDAEDEKGAA